MAGFSFDTGGRRCIRPILEKYQAGKDHPNIDSIQKPIGYGKNVSQ